MRDAWPLRGRGARGLEAGSRCQPGRRLSSGGRKGTSAVIGSPPECEEMSVIARCSVFRKYAIQNLEYGF